MCVPLLGVGGACPDSGVPFSSGRDGLSFCRGGDRPTHDPADAAADSSLVIAHRVQQGYLARGCPHAYAHGSTDEAADGDSHR